MEQSGVLTTKEILQVACQLCHSRSGLYCQGMIKERFHLVRIIKAQRNKEAAILGYTLTSGEKSMVVYYAFIQLCDSVASKSKEMFDKEMTSIQIQAFFVQTAMKEARKDGLIDNAIAGPNSESRN